MLEPQGYELAFDRLERSPLYEIIPLDLSRLCGPQTLFYNEPAAEDGLLGGFFAKMRELNIIADNMICYLSEVEGRIINIADQYDALRNKRVYKPAFDHATSFGIISKCDGRIMPSHFDPKALSAFISIAPEFEEIYERLKG